MWLWHQNGADALRTAPVSLKRAEMRASTMALLSGTNLSGCALLQDPFNLNVPTLIAAVDLRGVPLEAQSAARPLDVQRGTEPRRAHGSLDEGRGRNWMRLAMHKQRIFLLTAATVGALACFLPWVNLPIVGSMNGVAGVVGQVTLALFVGAGILVLLGDRTATMPTPLGLGAAALGFLCVVVGAGKVVELDGRMASIHEDLKDNPFAAALTGSVSVGVGLYLVVVAGVAMAASWWLLRGEPRVRTKSSVK